jgi:hypothetical protein
MRRLSVWRRWTLILLTLGLTERLVRYLLCFPIWGDEAFICLNLMDRDWAGLAGRLRFEQVAPLLFLWGEKAAYLALGGAELSLRLLPLVAGLASLLLFARLARLTLRPAAALAATGILAVAYYPVRHSCEVKPYSFDLLMSLILLVPAAAYLRFPQRRSPLVFLVGVVPFLLAASYPAVLTAAAVSLALFGCVRRQRDRGAWLLYLAFNGVMGVAFLGLYLGVGREQSRSMLEGSSGYWDATFPPGEPLALLRWLFDVHAGNMLAYPAGGRNGGSILTLLLCLAGAVSLSRRRRDLLLLLSAPFALTFLAAALRKYPYGGSARVAQHLAPSICLLAGAGLVALLGRLTCCPILRRRCLLALSAGLVLCGCIGMLRDMHKPYKTASDQRARAFVRQVLKAGGADPVIVLAPPPRLYPSFEWYLRLEGSRVHWADSPGELDLATEQRFWCLRFTTNEAADALPLRWDGPFVPGGGQEHALNMGPEPEATRSCVVSRWLRAKKKPPEELRGPWGWIPSDVQLSSPTLKRTN